MKLKEYFEEYDKKALFDDGWSSFIAKLKTLSGNEPLPEILSTLDISEGLYEKTIRLAVSEWKESPSRSILHGISHMNIGQIPAAGSQIFPTLEWQTRFLLQCKNHRLISILDIGVIKKSSGEKETVKGEHALTIKRPEVLNNVLRCLYLYRYLNNLKKVKLPKVLYRGIRAHDIYNHETLQPLVSAIWKADKTHEMKRKEAIDIMNGYIITRGLNKIASSGRILSFTSSMPIAKYFANGEGIILKVDPSKVEIVTSEKHDEVFDQQDYFNGKHEHEYIVRIPDDYEFSKDDIIIVDKDYFIAENNPLCVQFFDHDNIEAIYTLNGTEIKAYFSWNSSGTGGSIRFNWDTRGNFKKSYGFDPLPTVDNLENISNFHIKKRRNY